MDYQQRAITVRQVAGLILLFSLFRKGSVILILTFIINSPSDEKENEEEIKNNQITLAKKGQDMLFVAVVNLKKKNVEIFMEAIEAKTAVTKVTQGNFTLSYTKVVKVSFSLLKHENNVVRKKHFLW